MSESTHYRIIIILVGTLKVLQYISKIGKMFVLRKEFFRKLLPSDLGCRAEVWVGQAGRWIHQQPPEQIYVAVAVIAVTIVLLLR